MGERGKPRSERDVMNPGTDNLLPTHTRAHAHGHKKPSHPLTARLRTGGFFIVSSLLSCHSISHSFAAYQHQVNT